MTSFLIIPIVSTLGFCAIAKTLGFSAWQGFAWSLQAFALLGLGYALAVVFSLV